METAPDKLNRAHDLFEEAVSILEGVCDELGLQLVGSTPLHIAASHGRCAMQQIRLRAPAL